MSVKKPQPKFGWSEAVKADLAKRCLDLTPKRCLDEVLNSDSISWGCTGEDLPRNKEKIKQSREWILDKTNGYIGLLGLDSSPNNVVRKGGLTLTGRIFSPWVAHAMKELERTGVRCAIPSGHSGPHFREGDRVIYVGLPN